MAPQNHPEFPYWRALAVQAMVWAWPLYEMQRMRAATAPRRTEADGFAGDDPKSPWRWFNTFTHARQRLRPGGSRVVLPNNDTLYSNAWLDLTDNHGLVIDLPDMGDRYHVLGLMDFYTNPFAHLGTRLHGNRGGSFLITPPGWQGAVPEPFEKTGRHVPAPTPWVWLIGRLLVDSDEDLPKVTALQDRMSIRTLPDWLEGRPARPLRSPVAQGFGQPFSWRHFLQVVGDAMVHCPPAPEEAALAKQWETLGLSPDSNAHTLPLRPVIESAWDEATAQVLKMLDMPFDQLGCDQARCGWAPSLMPLSGRFDGDFLRRAVIARQAIGAVAPQEALYLRCESDSDGQVLHGEHAYRIRFAPGQLPPVQAFWSMTMYDASDGMLVANPIDRFSIGDRTPGLQPDEDGGLTLYLQHQEPTSPAGRANWLPSPAGGFTLCLRAYLPHPHLVEGLFVLAPPVRCIEPAPACGRM